jgi:hypothetical protein
MKSNCIVKRESDALVFISEFMNGWGSSLNNKRKASSVALNVAASPSDVRWRLCPTGSLYDLYGAAP